MGKLRIGLLFGGRSVEHDVSIVSATSISSALDRSKYSVSLVAIDPEGRWHLANDQTTLAEVADEKGGSRVFLPAAPGEATLIPEDPASQSAIESLGDATRLDVIFPIVHGRGGEDGALQGLFELAGIPYVGSGVLSSALQMDKDFAKRLLEGAGLPVTPWITFRAGELDRIGLQQAAARAADEIGLPLFVKPANSGSSIGIARADSIPELVAALADARRFDRKVIAEKAIDAREIEVAVLGNDEPEASVPGEIRSSSRFYDYDAKYRDDATELIVPAELDPDEAARLRSLALDAYRALDAEGLARVDFLIDRDTNEPYINELNSLPGFTDGSMYPKLWEASGLPYPALLDRLIGFALERHGHRSRLVTRPPDDPRET